MSSLIISILIWFTSISIIKVRENEQELNAVFHAMDSLIIEFDNDGKYLKIPTSNTSLLIRPKEELLKMTLYDNFPKEKAEIFHNAILKCLKTKELIQIEYSLQIGDKKKWFATRISWKSEQSVIFHAVDITEQKNARQKIVQSEKRLKELNATKDKFFSIIAHDLKSPFNVILGFSNLLKTEYDQMEPTQINKLISTINDSSKSAFKLVENLLLWANAQRNKIELTKERLNLKKLVVQSIEAYLSAAENKNIQIEIQVPILLNIYADEFMLRTIIANLFNNAIKFTNKKSEIKIEAKQTDEHIEICVADNGIGIPPEIIPNLFLIGENVSTLGTDNENGTGLGLLLCKEFVAKHNGRIWAESILGKESKFYFTIPVYTNYNSK